MENYTYYLYKNYTLIETICDLVVYLKPLLSLINSQLFYSESDNSHIIFLY